MVNVKDKESEGSKRKTKSNKDVITDFSAAGQKGVARCIQSLEREKPATYIVRIL